MLQVAHKKDIPTEMIVTIEKLSNLGYGIARVDGYVIFVDGACPEDEVKVRLIKKNKNYANAVIIEIIKPSPHRIQPICPMQKVCGACQLQFIDYNFQLTQKKEIVKDAMHGLNITVGNVIPSPKTEEYRRKIQYPVSQTRDSKRIISGYYKPNSHDLVNIKYCPIQPKSCDEIIEYVRNNAPKFGISGYQEKLHAGDLRHILIRSSELTEKNLVIFVINSSKILDKVKDLALQMYKDVENVSGVGINLNPNKTNLILGETTSVIQGDDYIEEKLCNKIFKVSADTFFQINPTSANNIFEYVKKHISENYDKPMVLDAYAGITAFGICLSDVSKKVVSVEENKSSVDLASKIIKENGINNVELHNMDAGMFFEKELKTKGRKFDVTVLDPPRKGCTKESLDYALKLTKNEIIYVSCNPSTLARDLKYLVENGCKVDFVQPFDMFPHTYHIENVAIIKTK